MPNYSEQFGAAEHLPLKPYTMLLLRPDYEADNYGQDTYLAHVEATDPCHAAEVAQAEAMKVDGHTEEDETDPGDYFVLFTADGHIDDLTDHT